MLTYYQPFLLPFLGPKQSILPHGITQAYFLSFEDALWNLLTVRHIPYGAMILLPDFYCMDVAKNIRNHGWSVAYYPLDDGFQISFHRLTQITEKMKPAVIVLFHACGIPNRIAKQKNQLKKLCDKHLIIEDCVHTALALNRIIITHRNHVYIDSLRKVSPIPGSFLYQHKSAQPVAPSPVTSEWWYVAGVHGLYCLFRMVYAVAVLIGWQSLAGVALTTILKKHDDLVGNNATGYAGNPVWKYVHSFMDTEKLENTKRTQVRRYRFLLSHPPLASDVWKTVPVQVEAEGLLHVYPIIVKKPEVSYALERHLAKAGVRVWHKFPDSPWSRRRRVLYLPLGYHVTDADIKNMVLLLRQFKYAVMADKQ